MSIIEQDSDKIIVSWKYDDNKTKEFTIMDSYIDDAMIEDNLLFYQMPDKTVMVSFNNAQITKQKTYDCELIRLVKYFGCPISDLLKYDLLQSSVSAYDITELASYFNCGLKILEYSCLAKVGEVLYLLEALEYFCCGLSVLTKYPVIVEMTDRTLVMLDEAYGCGLKILDRFDSGDFDRYGQELLSLAQARWKLGGLVTIDVKSFR